jgi:hypothetical protein
MCLLWWHLVTKQDIWFDMIEITNSKYTRTYRTLSLISSALRYCRIVTIYFLPQCRIQMNPNFISEKCWSLTHRLSTDHTVESCSKSHIDRLSRWIHSYLYVEFVRQIAEIRYVVASKCESKLHWLDNSALWLSGLTGVHVHSFVEWLSKRSSFLSRFT